MVAHLFGGQVDIEPIAKLTRARDLLLIEDCAQAYIGNGYVGDDRAEVSMFSFGPIKTCSALGGGIFTVRDAKLKKQMERVQCSFTQQCATAYASRMMKYSLLKLVSQPAIAKAIGWGFRVSQKDRDRFISQAARGFRRSNFFGQIRQQPSAALIKMLARKLSEFRSQTIEQRIRLAEIFRNEVKQNANSPIEVVGSQTLNPTYWVLPILVNNPDQVIAALWKQGFDATRLSSMVAGNNWNIQCDCETVNSQRILDQIVYLPFSESMPESAIKKMGQIVRKVAHPAK